MIDPRSRSLEWIRQAKDRIPGVDDTPLKEKAIRALTLLEKNPTGGRLEHLFLLPWLF